MITIKLLQMNQILPYGVDMPLKKKRKKRCHFNSKNFNKIQ